MQSGARACLCVQGLQWGEGELASMHLRVHLGAINHAPSNIYISTAESDNWYAPNVLVQCYRHKEVKFFYSFKMFNHAPESYTHESILTNGGLYCSHM